MSASQRTDLARQFSLAGFTGDGYEKGRPVPVQVLWLMLSYGLIMRWWCPNRLRLLILRALGAKIGEGVPIRHGVKIHWPWKLTIGANSWVGEDSWILNLEPVTIGSDACISQGVLLCTGSHDRTSPTFEFDNGPIGIGDSVWIAARATVLRGVSIADGATVGATCRVDRDVPPGAIHHPAATQIRERP